MRTDVSGVATFTSLKLMDARNYQCIQFTFILGQYEMNVTSSPSQQVCFKNSISILIESLQYSKFISRGFAFPQPVSIRVLYC